MATELSAALDDRLEIMYNFRQKKLHRANQISSFPINSFTNRKNVRTPTNVPMYVPKRFGVLITLGLVCSAK